MQRGATIKLTKADKRAARKAVLDSRQGMIRDDGSPWIILAVAIEHFGTKFTRDEIYAAGNGIADWLGLKSWVQVITMQNPKRVNQMRKLLRMAS